MRRRLRWIVAVLAVVVTAPACHGRTYHRHPPVATQPAAQVQQPAAPAPEGEAAPPPEPAPAQEPAPPAQSQSDKAATLAVTFETGEVQAVLGKDVRSSSDEDMGRLVDVVVDRQGQPRAAIIDFGGFLGVGSRKIAVDWGALNFAREAAKGVITVELTRDQVKAAPEFKEGSPVVVLGAVTGPQPSPSTPAPLPPKSSQPQER